MSGPRRGRRPKQIATIETLEKERETFLEALRRGATVTASALAAGVCRATVYRWREDSGADGAFSMAWDDAVESGTDLMEDEARRRGVDGVEEPIMYKGVQVTTVRRYSDTMLAMLLNARRPEKFRQNHKHEHSGVVRITIAKDDADL